MNVKRVNILKYVMDKELLKQNKMCVVKRRDSFVPPDNSLIYEFLSTYFEPLLHVVSLYISSAIAVIIVNCFTTSWHWHGCAGSLDIFPVSFTPLRCEKRSICQDLGCRNPSLPLNSGLMKCRSQSCQSSMLIQ